MYVILNKDIRFYKEQIRYYQNLLEDTIHERNRLLNELPCNTPSSLTKLKKRKKSKKCTRHDNNSAIEVDNTQHSTSEQNSLENDLLYHNNEDRRIIMRMIDPDVRNGLKIADQECDQIRDYEKELINKGMTPLEAQKTAREKLYPASIPYHKQDDTQQSHTYTNQNINADMVTDAANALFENNLTNTVEQIIEDGNNVPEEDILDEKIVLEIA